MAIADGNRLLQVNSVLIMLMVQSFSGLVVSNPSMSVSPLSSSPVTFVMSRGEAYYVSAIPTPSSPNLLRFDWNVSVSYSSTGQGSIQFSRDNSTWANLASYYLIFGQAQGKQAVDSSWARSGTNYLRASYNQSSSVVLILKVFVNYSATILLILSPIIITIAFGTGLYFLRKHKKQRNPVERPYNGV
ncbi:hypothetical protein E6H36_12175 [Candidatus Bathyarchaeota archaeon]|nr:MAG: hypothetical protein E6H36_12175 [Candidatus Bathyarchaeota archaeon]